MGNFSPDISSYNNLLIALPANRLKSNFYWAPNLCRYKQKQIKRNS